MVCVFREVGTRHEKLASPWNFLRKEERRNIFYEMEALNQRSIERVVSHRALQMGTSFPCQICVVGFLCGVCLASFILAALTSFGNLQLDRFHSQPRQFLICLGTLISITTSASQFPSHHYYKSIIITLILCLCYLLKFINRVGAIQYTFIP